MAYKLFYALGSAAMGTRVMLEEIGAPYELIQTTIAMDEPRPLEQLALNPNGWVPVLIWGENAAMYECAAITMFLCDRHPEANLAPAIDDPNGACICRPWCTSPTPFRTRFSSTTIRTVSPTAPADEPSAQRRGNRRLRETWKVIDDQIGDNEWLLGERFSAADIYLFMLTTWLQPSRGHPSVDAFPNVERIADAVMQRPSVQLVYESGLRSTPGTHPDSPALSAAGTKSSCRAGGQRS